MSQFIEMFGDPLKNPKNFTQRKLEEVATLLNGRAYKASELLSAGKYLVLRVGNFFTNSDYYYSDLELEPDKYCDTGDILYSWSATLGAQIWKGGKVIYHYHIWKVLFDENILNKEFFCYMLNVMTDSLKQETHGSTMVHLTKEGMEKKVITIPTLELQQQFVTILEQADKSGFDGFKSQFIEMSKDKGYPSAMIKSFADVSTGGTPSKVHPEYWNGDKPWVSAEDMKSKYVYDTCEKVTDAGYATCKIIPVDTLMYVCRGSIGVMAINKIECATNQSICRATCHDNVCNVEFLYHALMYQRDNIKKMGTGTSFKSLNQTTFSELEIDLPPYDEQMKFVTIAQQADKSGSILQYMIAC